MAIHALPNQMALGVSADWSPSLTVLMLGHEVCALISGVSGSEA